MTREEHDAKVRSVIAKKMLEMAEELGSFEQTTHGEWSVPDISFVLLALDECWKEPRAFTISTLAQRIDKFFSTERTS